MAKDVPSLGGGLIVRKGEAAPTPPTPKGISGTIAVTVRLDPERYERLKMHGARRRRTNQQIIVAALDAYLPAAGS